MARQHGSCRAQPFTSKKGWLRSLGLLADNPHNADPAIVEHDALRLELLLE
jgi:hypothetical protein